MLNFYLEKPPTHKYFDPWGVENLLLLLASWAQASSLTYFKLSGKTSTLLLLVTANVILI